MKYAALILPVLLSGCIVVPVKRNFPDVPAELVEACPALKQVKSTTELSVVIDNVAENYATYHKCKAKTDAWVEWYSAQKKIFEDVK